MAGISRRKFLRTGSGALGLSAAAGLGARPAAARSAARSASGGLAAGWPSAPALVASSPLDKLRKQLKGTLLVPGDKGFDDAVASANGRYLSTRPMAAALCADEQDVVTCVDWARRYDVQPVGRTGGHSYAGFSTTTGLIVDMGRLNAVSIDRDNGTATVGGGALNANVFSAAMGGPLFLPVGTCLGVGVGGLTLGGGIGYTTHWQGLTCDHLRTSRIVTASGEALDLPDRQHGDLFWACRGGAGGSFGLNTEFVFDLAEVPKQNVTFYRFDWRGADAATGVFTTFDDILATAPPELNAVAQAQAVPVGSQGPREAITTFCRGQYIGPSGDLYDLVRPLIADVGVPIHITITEMPFWDVQKIFASSEAEKHSFGDISRYAATKLPAGVVDDMVSLLAKCPSRSDDANGSLWSLGWIGGAVMNSVGRTDTAYVHRGMQTLWRPTPVWPNDAPASVGQGLIEWTNEVVDLLRPHTPDESYQNFPNRLITDWRQEYYGENFARLVKVKTKYDPRNVFHNLQSIPVA
jgi:FAD/FMN-containing dehydrogenase